MKLNDNVYVLELSNMDVTNPDKIYLTLINDFNHGLTLIDTGYPGQLSLLKKAIENEGFSVQDLNYIVLTHQDIDHVGNVTELLNLKPEIKVISSENEKRYLNGECTPVKVATLEQNLAFLPEQMQGLYHMMNRFFKNNNIPNIQTVNNGDHLPFANNIKVISTFGHTPGHISLYLEKHKLLIAGDALTIQDGKLIKTSEQLNYDNTSYNQSLEKISNLTINTIICYHGGILTIDELKF